MHKPTADPISRCRQGFTTSFSVVRIEDVPVPKPSDLADTFRRVVLVVEDEPGIADELTETLARSGYATIASHDAKSALETALLIPPDMVVIDVALEGTSGFELANSLRERLPDCIRVMFSRELPNSDLLAAVNAA